MVEIDPHFGKCRPLLGRTVFIIGKNNTLGCFKIL